MPQDIRRCQFDLRIFAVVAALMCSTFFLTCLAEAEPPRPKSEAKPDAKPDSKPDAKSESKLVSITRVVGEVDTHIVTSREVRIEDAVQQALEAKPSSADGFVILSGAEKGFPGAVTQVLESWMVYLEAKALANQELSKTEVSRGVGLVQEKWSGHPAWLALEVGQDELKQVVERQLIVRAFEKLRNDPQLSPISDDDALLFYKKNRLRFGSLPFSSFKDNIKAYLIKQQTEKRLADWHENLRRKYKVRNFISG